MWKLAFIVWSLALSNGGCQYLSRQQLAPSPATRHDDGAGWDIRLAVPGEPDRDYPTLASVPKTGFSCAGKDAGYYADVETRCQVFRVCTIGATYGFQSFLCPNGTLFNQQVFVCDWWMNVNCQGSQRYYNSNNNDKFGKLRLGQSMMSDIKKMLTYPMVNPYNTNNNYDNHLVMQVYNPPSGQPFSNGRLLAGNQGSHPAQQLQLPDIQNEKSRYNEIHYSASTPSPQYVPSKIDQSSNFIAANGQVNQIQNEQYRQQNGQYVKSQANSAGTFSNSPNGHLGQLRNEINGNVYSQQWFPGQSWNVQNGQYTNGQTSQLSQLQNSQHNIAANAQFQNAITNSQKYQFSNTQNTANQIQGSQYNNNAYQSGKLVQYANNFNGEYMDDQKITQNTADRQNELEITFTKQQYTYPSQYDKQYTYKIPTDQSINNQQLQQVKQNLVSEPSFNSNPVAPASTSSVYSQPTILTKTLTLSHDLKSGKLLSTHAPNSRITFSAWVTQPSTAALVSKSGPSKYEGSKSARQYLTPTISRPTISSKLYMSHSTPKPTVASGYSAPLTRPIPSSSRLYLAPMRPTVSSRLIIPTTIRPSRLYSTPSTTKIAVSSSVYSPPNLRFSAKLRAPPSSPEPIYNRNAQVRASASTPAPAYLAPLKNDQNNQSFTITKHSHINTNHNNLTFTDILTKEKLDITVNDIVKDTSNILKNDSDSKLGQLREQIKNQEDDINPSPTYLPSQSPSAENINLTNTHKLVVPSTTATLQSARLTKDPSISLELPLETFKNDRPNQIATLPYFKPKKTERTVSLKITIPERTAQFILQSKNESEFDRLEILTTDSSSFLVLTNARTTKRANFIPLGKLVGDKNSNISNPQAFVYDFLTSSINAAKTYENTLNENAKKLHFATANTFGQQFQNIDAEDLNVISGKISQLTTDQYNNNFNSNKFLTANLPSTAHSTTNTGNTYRGSAKFTNKQVQNKQQDSELRSGQLRQGDEVSGNFYSSNFYNGNNGASAKLQVNPNQNDQTFHQVPDDINQNYKQQTSSHSSFTNANEQNLELNDFQSEQHTPNSDTGVNLSNESEEVELVNTGTPQLGGSPAKLQVAPTTVNPQVAQIFNSLHESSNKVSADNVNNERGVGAQFHKHIVGTINNPISDRNLITYKADKSFYVYTKYVGTGGNKLSSDTNNKQLGELQQSQQGDAYTKVEKDNQGRQVITTVQFIPSLGFQLDDENDQRDLVQVLQSKGGNSVGYKSGVEEKGYDRFSQNVESIPTRSADYSVKPTPNAQRVLQQYRNTPENLYAGPSSYSAPQSSVGRLEQPQRAQLNVLPSPATNNYPPAPARLEEFEDTAGYPKITPAIPFSF